MGRRYGASMGHGYGAAMASMGRRYGAAMELLWGLLRGAVPLWGAALGLLWGAAMGRCYGALVRCGAEAERLLPAEVRGAEPPPTHRNSP